LIISQRQIVTMSQARRFSGNTLRPRRNGGDSQENPYAMSDERSENGQRAKAKAKAKVREAENVAVTATTSRRTVTIC
jgi:hypothetical protein